MLQTPDSDKATVRRVALCAGIGTYTNLVNRDLRYAVNDATKVAERLADPQRGGFTVTLLTEQGQTMKAALEEVVEHLLNGAERQPEDLILLYFSCHGDVHTTDNTFCLLPSNATGRANGGYDPTTVIGVSDLARWFSKARAHNIVLLLDVCHSGGAGVAFQHFQLHLETGPNYFILGAARQDQITTQNSKLRHGLFTHCLLRAFEQPPTKDGWLTITQIQNFVSSDISWFARDQPLEIQASSFFVNPYLPILRNPGYPELCPLPPLWNVPFRRNDFFTGQEEVLSLLANMLHGEQKTALMQPYAISGMGGIGKTQLALEYAYRHRQDYHAILWGNANTRDTLISTFAMIASLLDLPEKDEKDQMVIVEAVKTWLAERTEWLLILDNANELALVKEFIPPAFRGHLLLTTRDQIGGGLARQFEVKVLRPEIGALLLLRRSKLLEPGKALEQASPETIKQAQELAQELGGLPLALDQAGAYVDEMQCNLERYLRIYRARRALLLQRRGKLVDHPESVSTTLSLSLEEVEYRNSVAINIMRLCAHLSSDAIPEEFFTRKADEAGEILVPLAADEFELDEAIAALRAYSLVSRDKDTQTLTVHRLVQAIIVDTLPIETQQQWKQRAVLTVSAACPDVKDVEHWDVCECWLPHALICATWIEQEQIHSWESRHLLHQAGYYLDERGRYDEAEPLYQRALMICEQLDPNHPNTAGSLNNLAALYYARGRYKEAETLYKRALAIREQQLGPEHRDTTTSLNNLAALYMAQGKYGEAEVLYQRALMICNQYFGPNHPNTAGCLNNLAALYYERGLYKKAEPLFKQALAIREQQLGLAHPHMAFSLNNLAALYQVQGKYGEAEPLFKQALAIREQQLGVQHPDTAASLDRLASLYQVQGKYGEAEPLFKQALAIREQQLGSEHPNTAFSLNNLANLYHVWGKHTDAEPLYQRALKICKCILGHTHPSTLKVGKNYSSLQREMKRSKKRGS